MEIGRNRDRTCDPRLVRAVLSQLSYSPEFERMYQYKPNVLLTYKSVQILDF